MWFSLEKNSKYDFLSIILLRRKNQSESTQKTIMNIFHVTNLVDHKKKMRCLSAQAEFTLKDSFKILH